MTCIVAITDGRRIVLGADSAAVSANELQLRATRKIFKKGPYAIGFIRSWRMGQILQYHTEFPEPPPHSVDETLEEFMAAKFVEAVRESCAAYGFSKRGRITLAPDMIEEGQEIGGVFVVGVSGRLFEVREDFHVARPMRPYTALGYGAPIALGALFALQENKRLQLEERAHIALEASEAYSQKVRQPFQFVEIGP
jgi:ATP-dependent protease HslVU (ClpYQ) peptidase subunit